MAIASVLLPELQLSLNDVRLSGLVEKGRSRSAAAIYPKMPSAIALQICSGSMPNSLNSAARRSARWRFWSARWRSCSARSAGVGIH